MKTFKLLILLQLINIVFPKTIYGQIELLTNGNFGSLNNGWSASGDFYYNFDFQQCNLNSCPGYAYVSNPNGTTGSNLAGDISQVITIPSSAASASLSFYTFIGTLVQGSNPIDYLQAYFIYGSNQLHQIAVLSNLDYSATYVQRTYSIPSYLFGTPLTLYFQGGTDFQSAGTKFRLDDVSLKYVPGTTCSFSLSPSNVNISSSGTSSTFFVSTTSGCNWSAVSSNSSWLHTFGSGIGSNNCSYTVDANFGSQRSGYITIGNQTFNVTQDGLNCNYSLNPSSINQNSTSISSSFSVSVASGCSWTANSSDPSWLHTSSIGTGNGNCFFVIDANNGSARNGTITIGTQSFLVSQTGFNCSYTLTPSNITGVSSNGVSNNIFNISTSGTCAWTATTSDNWIHPSGGTTGSGSCTYNVDANLGGARTGHINISGTLFTINQNGATPITYKDIANIRIYADNFVPNGANVWFLSGNVYAVPKLNCSPPSEVLHFTGNTIAIDQNFNTISSANGSVFCSGIGGIGTVTIFQNGGYNLQATNDIFTCSTFDLVNTVYKLADLDIEFNSIQVLCDGIKIDGDLSLPSILSRLNIPSAHINFNVNSLYMRTSGIDLAGGIGLTNIRINNNLNLQYANLDFDTYSDIFTGSARMITPAFNMNATIGIANAQLDNLGVGIASTTQPVPLFSTGLAIDSVGGGLQHISTPPLTLYLGARISPYVGFTIPSLGNLRIQTNYTLGTSFNAWGSFSLFNHDIANTGFTVSPGLFQLTGDMNILNTLYGHASLSVSNTNNYPKIEGCFNANITTPAIFPSHLTWLNRLYAGITLASTDNYLTNSYLAGSGQLLFLRLFYNLNMNGGLHFDWGTDINILPLEAQNQIGPFRVSPNEHEPNNTNSINNLFSFNLFNTTPNLIISANGSSNLPEITLYIQNGDSINYTNYLSHSGVIYSIDSLFGVSTLIIRNPNLGKYFLSVINSDSVTVSTINSYPHITINQASFDTSSSTFEIAYNCSDPDDAALIKFGIDENMEGFNGIILQDSLNENNNNGLANITFDVKKTGNYYLYGIVSDSIGHLDKFYFNQPILIKAPSSPNSPSGLTLTTSDSTLSFCFNRNNLNPLNYILYYSNQVNGINYFSTNIAVGDSDCFSVNFLNPGKYYEFAISALDSNGNESAMSNIVNTNWISNTQNNCPTFSTTPLNPIATIGLNYQSQLSASDVDGGLLTYTLIEGPINLQYTSNGDVNWTPTNSDIGFNNIYFKVDDNNGCVDSAFYQILVTDSLTAIPTSYFNQSIYFHYSENPVITLNDPEYTLLNSVNQLPCNISSTTDPVGLNVLLNRQGNEFKLPVFLASSATLSDTLQISSNDSIWFKYTSPSSGKSITDFAIFTVFNADFNFTDSICSGDSVKFTNQSIGNNLSCIWNFGDSSLIQNEYGPSHSFPINYGSGFDVYSVKLIVNSSDGSIDSISKNILVFQKTLSTITPSGNISICEGDSLLLSSVSAVSHLWSNGDTTSQIFVKKQGNYFVNITDSNYCQSISNVISVNVNSIQTPVINGQSSVCSSASGILYAISPNYNSIFWTVDSALNFTGQNTNQISVNWGITNEGIVSVTVMDTITGCITDTAFTVTIDSALNPIISPAGVISICTGDSIMLDVGSGYSSYLWSNGATSPTVYISTSDTINITVSSVLCSGNSNIPAIIEIHNPINGLPISVNFDGYLISPYSELNTWYSYGDSIPLEADSLFRCTPDSSYFVVGIDANGCLATSDSINCIIDAVSLISQQSTKIYPNPSTGQFNISFEKSVLDCTIEVWNILNQRVYLDKKKNVTTGQIEVLDLNVSEGTYLLRLTLDKETIVQTLIIRE